METKAEICKLLAGAVTLLLMTDSFAAAETQVVVLPIGGTVGNATAADVVKGKTFSSRKAGRGVKGTLELPHNAQTFTNSNGMRFNLLPAGSFTMGSPESEPGRGTDETQHEVTLTRSVYMQTTEVTQKQWQDIIGNNPATSNHGDLYPLETVNWFEAAFFANTLSQDEGRSECYTLTGCSPIPGNDMECTGVSINSGCSGYRLPTEAEWEYAARATTTTAYANPVNFDVGNTETGSGYNSNLHAMGWYEFNNEGGDLSRDVPGYSGGTKPVAQKQANRWGLYDMHGNVWEWCQDWYAAYAGDATDPTGPADGSRRLVRGGSWNNDARFARSATRISFPPGLRSLILGFRLVLPPGQ
jgi:formylglycine-generating enzyme required for sulfatase activity